MDFVDKKKSICTLGDFCSYRAVSSKLPIAINESALYASRLRYISYYYLNIKHILLTH